MAKNTNLHSAKSAKNDEFYTMFSDIQRELIHYKSHFKDKIIFLNCDDPTTSEFWKYFHLNFEFFGLKKLVSTHYDSTQPTYKLEYLGGDDVNFDAGTKTDLKQNGDFRSPESIEILKESDIVVTNPPFSLFREFIALLIEHEKKFIVVGNKNAITYKEIFPLIRDNKVWLGYNAVKEFRKPDNDIQKFGNIGWFTNLEIKKRTEPLFLFQEYDPNRNPKYDNYDAINCDRVDDIPKDYVESWGVPRELYSENDLLNLKYS